MRKQSDKSLWGIVPVLILCLLLSWVGAAVSFAQEEVSGIPSAIDSTLTQADTLSQDNSSILAADSLVQDSLLAADSLALDPLSMMDTLAHDSLMVDTLAQKKKKPEGGGLTAVVNYTAKDSLVFTMGNLAFLYGGSTVTYDDIELNAQEIQMSLDSSLVHANGIKDTASQNPRALVGAPVFKDKSGEYETRTMSYNFKTAKGYITDVTTQQGEGYVTGGTTKKMPDNDIFLENGKYTTCDHTECPHFYIQLTKARVRPKKNIVTGPAYLVVADVPLPLAIPFGFFPFTKSYSSGVIVPSYGAEQTRGLYLRDGGYYFAINDYIDLALKGEVYTKGSWGISASSKYAWRYKFSGNYQFSYMITKTGDKGMPDYAEQKNFKAVWSHTQDSRFNPNMTLSASVNFTTSGYERNNLTSYYSSDMTQSTKSSTVNASWKIPNSNWNISASTSITQRTQDSTLDVRLPDLTISMSRLYPFKRKVKAGADRWYEKIAMSYTGRMTNSVQCKQDKFKDQSLIHDWKNGMQHNIPISASFTVLNYINITPSFNFTDRMYTHKTTQFYDPAIQNADGTYGGIARDTTYGFYNVYNYSTSISANTKIYGMWKPIFKSRLYAVRHLFTPTLSFSYNPDFSRKRYGSWSTYMMPDSTGWKEVQYSNFQGYNYGTTSQGMQGSVSLSLNNNIEAKIRTDKDSTGYKKISIIDNLSTSISYNMAADSMKWSQTLPVNASFKLGKQGSMNLSATFDTYCYDANGRHIDKLRLTTPGKGPLRLMNTGYSYSYQLNNKKLAQLFGFGKGDDKDKDNSDLDEEDEDMMEGDVDQNLEPSYEKERSGRRKKDKTKGASSTYDADGYLIWSIPWTLNMSYTMRYAYGTFNKEKREYDLRLTHSATISGTIQPTKAWNFNYSLSYDFNQHEVTYMTMNCSRDMHCWQLTASLNPMGRYASFNVCIAVKSSMLQDMKYEKSSVSRSNKIDWYDD